MTKKIKVISADDAPERVSRPSRGRPSIYPWDTMGVGDCFLVPDDKVQSVRQSISNKNNADSDKRYSLAKGEDGNWYAWRDA